MNIIILINLIIKQFTWMSIVFREIGEYWMKATLQEDWLQLMIINKAKDKFNKYVVSNCSLPQTLAILFNDISTFFNFMVSKSTCLEFINETLVISLQFQSVGTIKQVKYSLPIETIQIDELQRIKIKYLILEDQNMVLNRQISTLQDQIIIKDQTIQQLANKLKTYQKDTNSSQQLSTTTSFSPQSTHNLAKQFTFHFDKQQLNAHKFTIDRTCIKFIQESWFPSHQHYQITSQQQIPNHAVQINVRVIKYGSLQNIIDIGFITVNNKTIKCSGNVGDIQSAIYWASHGPYSLSYGGKAHFMIAGQKQDKQTPLLNIGDSLKIAVQLGNNKIEWIFNGKKRVITHLNNYGLDWSNQRVYLCVCMNENKDEVIFY